MATYWDAFVQDCPKDILEREQLVVILHLFYEYCHDRKYYLKMLSELQQRGKDMK